jgi:hypothetical protein
MEKGNSKKEMLERFEQMGIPKPISNPIKTPPKTSSNPEMQSKLEQIRNGGLKNNYKTFIEKAEKTSSVPSSLPVPKVGKKPNQTPSKSPEIKSFTPKNTQASMYEQALYGDSNSNTANYNLDSRDMEYSVKSIDTKSLLEQRLREKMQKGDVIENSNPNQTISINEEDLMQKMEEIAKKVSTDMIKKVITELSKSEGGLIFESKKIRKAEVVGKNKVKIGGKVYSLTPVK